MLPLTQLGMKRMMLVATPIMMGDPSIQLLIMVMDKEDEVEHYHWAIIPMIVEHEGNQAHNNLNGGIDHTAIQSAYEIRPSRS
jgi:hypothetical protein